MRKTIGFHKVEDKIRNNQFIEMTGLRKQHVYRAIQELIQRKIVTKNGYKLALNTEFTQWRALPKMVTQEKVTKIGYSKKVTKIGKKVTKIGNDSIYKRNFTKESIYILLFDHWNSLGIISHRKLTGKMKTKMRSALKDYSADEIKDAISNFAKVLKSEDHYWTKKWTLEDFLSRGLVKFSTESDPLNNFQNWNSNKKKTEITRNETELYDMIITEADK